MITDPLTPEQQAFARAVERDIARVLENATDAGRKLGYPDTVLYAVFMVVMLDNALASMLRAEMPIKLITEAFTARAKAALRQMIADREAAQKDKLQ